MRIRGFEAWLYGAGERMARARSGALGHRCRLPCLPAAVLFGAAVICFMVVLAVARNARAQQAGPTDTRPADTVPDETAADLAHGRRLLEDVHDNVFSFDDPAFYWFCHYVKDHADPAVFSIDDLQTAVPWKFLAERPSDYRGRLVVIEGVLLSRPVFEVSGFGRRGIGKLHQCELSEVGTRALCAVICVEDPGDVAIRSRVRAKGYFIKVRRYQTNAGEIGAGPLIVARRLELVRPPASSLVGLRTGWQRGRMCIAIATALLAIVWLVLRRGIRGAAPARAKRPSRGEDAVPSEDDFNWLADVRRSGESETASRDETMQGD
ncbi:MAG: hypothetical protein JXQ75_00670 [Phycisphaerae bacterium]|nr:hypothetical protein [Phycisphaerae bacterium]